MAEQRMAGEALARAREARPELFDRARQAGREVIGRAGEAVRGAIGRAGSEAAGRFRDAGRQFGERMRNGGRMGNATAQRQPDGQRPTTGEPRRGAVDDGRRRMEQFGEHIRSRVGATAGPGRPDVMPARVQ